MGYNRPSVQAIESYRLIAPKRTFAKLAALVTTAAVKPRPGEKKVGRRRRS
jgi:hypothetical protein